MKFSLKPLYFFKDRGFKEFLLKLVKDRQRWL
jgi:hypothetical protein